MTKAYVAAPYAAGNDEGRYMNTQWAIKIGEILKLMGHEPVVVHERIYKGEWGDDNDPEARAAGMKATMGILDDVIRSGGSVAVLLRDDCTMSSGMTAEVSAAVAAGAPVAAMTYNAWCMVGAMLDKRR